MIQTTKTHEDSKPKEITEFKDNDLVPKGRTKHTVETDWPVKEALPAPKKRKIKRTQYSRLP